MQRLANAARRAAPLIAAATVALVASPAVAATAAGASAAQPVFVFGIPVDFILFGLTLLGVAIFHHKTLEVALTGLTAIVLYGIQTRRTRSASNCRQLK